MIVVDTNVLVYFLFPGPMTGTANAASRRDPDWAAPPLWRSELRNVLGRRVRNGSLPITDALETFRDAERILGDREMPVATWAVLDLVSRSGCTAYDGEFVALAQAQAVPLVTADAEILRLFPGIAVSLEEFARG
jgi:predicted nucleic acid-binding protein